MRNRAFCFSCNALKASLRRYLWVFILIVTLIYVASIALTLLYPLIIPNRQYAVNFTPTDVDLTSIPFETFSPSFELGTEEPLGWQSALWSGYAEFNKSSNMSKTGEYSGMIFANITTSAAFLTNSSNKYPVVSGETYSASAWVALANLSKGEGAIVSIAWFDSNDTYLSTTAGYAISNASSWKKIFVSGKAPPKATSAQLELHLHGIGSVWFDDVSFSQVITEYGESNWNAYKHGLETARLTADSSSLELECTFVYSTDEKLIYNMSLVSSVNTEDYAWMGFTYKTSSPNGGGFSIVLNYADETQVPVYGIAFSTNWKTTYVDVRKTPSYLAEFSNRLKTTPGKPIESISIILDDKPDTSSDGTYSLSLKTMTFYRYTAFDMFLALLAALLVFLISSFVMMGIPKLHLFWLLTLIGGIICSVTSAYRVVLPFAPLVYGKVDLLVIIQLISGFIILMPLFGKLRTTQIFTKLDTFYSHSNKKTVGLLLGLIFIPCIGLLLRFSNALTVPLFDDELSRAVTSWGLLHGRFVGLNLAGPWDPVTVDLLKTGVFTVDLWPSDLPMPFVSTLIYPSFTIVSPFIEPFVAHLITAPFVQILGFNEISLRLPFILMNVLSIMLVYVIASRNGNILAGLLGSLFFAIIPYSSYYGSKAFLDNAVGFFFLLSFYFFLKFKDNYNDPAAAKHLYISAILAALSTLSKIGAIFAPVFLVFALLMLRDLKKIYLLKVIILMTGIISIYPIIGFLVSPKAFLLSMSGFLSYTQTAITVELSGALPVFEQLALIGATLIGLSCFVYQVSTKEKDNLYVNLAIVTYFLILLFVFTYAKEHYFVALMSFLSVTVGLTLSHILRNVKPVEIMFFYSIITFVLDTTFSYHLYFLGFLMFLNILYLWRSKTGNTTNNLKRIIQYLSLLYIPILFSIIIYDAWRYVFLY